MIWGLGAVCLALLAAVGASRIQLANERAAHAQTKAKHATVLQGLAERTAKASETTLAALQAQQQAIALYDTKRTQELSHAQRQISDLRTRLDRGTARLRVAATCPSSNPVLSETPTSAGVVDAAAPELTPDARQAYLDHRRDIEALTAQVLALQDYVRIVSGEP